METRFSIGRHCGAMESRTFELEWDCWNEVVTVVGTTAAVAVTYRSIRDRLAIAEKMRELGWSFSHETVAEDECWWIWTK
jgi:hypothetical protein